MNACDVFSSTAEKVFSHRPVRRVVCAACRSGELIIAGARHFDSVMHRQIAAIDPEKRPRHWEQGFIDQFGVFMNRQEAMQVALAAGQPVDIERGCGGDKTTLYSEGLY